MGLGLRLIGCSCVLVLLVSACGDSFSGDEEGSGASGASGASGTGGKASGGKSSGSGGSGADAGEATGGDDDPIGTAGATVGVGGSGVVPEGCPVDPDGDGHCRGALAAASFGTCAIHDGAVRCWGLNEHLQLGDDGATHENCADGADLRDCSTVPVTVSDLTDVYSVAGGAQTNCAIDSQSILRCWGLDVMEANAPDMPTPSAFGGSNPILVSLRTPIGALAGDGRVRMAGIDEQASGVYGDGEPSVALEQRSFSLVPGLENALHLDVGWYHVCAVIDGGSVVCWGKGVSGEIGDGFQENRNAPTPVQGVTNAIAVAVGDAVSYALLDDGTVSAWGGNDRGQLGNGAALASPTAVKVKDLDDAIEIDAGFGHACALRETGQVVCWGTDGEGQLGDDATHPQCSESNTSPCSREPVEVKGTTDAQTISLGAGHSCALLQSGDVVCWGSNDFGQLGSGDFAESPTPVSVVDL
jgi:alpha-tubulin suppressor-like RCC1 family protein